MKTFYLFLFLFSSIVTVAHSQSDENEFIKATQSVVLTPGQSSSVFNAITQQNPQDFIDQLRSGLTGTALAPFIATATRDISQDSVLIFVFRPMNANRITDFNASKTIIYHRKNGWYDAELSNYLLESKHITIISLDLDNSYYLVTADAPDKLSNSKVNISYQTSFFKQSVKDLPKALRAMGGATPAGIAPSYVVNATITEIEPHRIKAPCTLELSNKSFTSDLKFVIHERNVASVQIGLVNSKFNVNNFSIDNNNLIVKADTTQQKNWKSNLYALLEIHLPRDIDNFRPLWKDFFYFKPKDFTTSRDSNNFRTGNVNCRRLGKATLDWLFRNTLHRAGVYGGVKISKDPLSNLYAGFNYAITKQLSINFGWSWANEITPQITEIGNITSLSDAKEFAKRKYSKPNFAIGLSFSPSAAISTLGIKDKEEK